MESQRSYLRRLISNHAGWPAIKRRDNLNIAMLNMATIQRLCIELGIDPNAMPPIVPAGEAPEAPLPFETEDESRDEPIPPLPHDIETDEPMKTKTVTKTDTLNGLSEAEAAILVAVREANRVAAERAALNAGASESRIIELINEHAPKPSQVAITIARGPDIQKAEGLFHYKFALVVTAIAAGLHVMLVGPAGSGKTTLGHQVAEALGLPFYFTGAIASEYKLSGFIDAQGVFRSMPFFKAFTEGGVFLFDEIDASMPQALLAFNAALANGHADFPTGNFKRHPDFRCIAAANTFGRGSSRLYVGRNQLDAASLDRFVTIALDYDTRLEAAMLGIPAPQDAPRPISIEARPESDVTVETPLLVARVRRVRNAIDTLNGGAGSKDAAVRHVVSPRASQAYVKLYAAGWPKDTIEAAVIWKGCDPAMRAKIEAAL